MKKMAGLILIGCIMLSGCNTDTQLKISKLEAISETMEERVSSLERKIDMMMEKLSVCEEFCKNIQPAKKKETAALPAGSISDESIQSALKNAGYYNGPIDGKIGPDTVKAIREFQKANGLKVDGVAGAKTKSLLIKHLSECVD